MVYDIDLRVTRAEVARRLNVSPQLVSWWCLKGYLKPVARRGRSPLYRLGDAHMVDVQARSNTQRSHRIPRPVPG